MLEECKNKYVVWNWERGMKTFCCKTHVEKYVEERNELKRVKISKSENELDSNDLD